ncbi:MAG: hypothetical protein H0W07_00995 [Chloroflexi bacterium]|nr:hypothetical protein [Chloroflexota bacterium]
MLGTVGAAEGSEGGSSGRVRALDFQRSSFPLARLPASELPFYNYPIPGLPLSWTPTDVDGIAMREWEDGRLYYHPVQLASYSFRLLSAYRKTGDAGYLDWARRYAAKIRSLAVESGGALFLPYQFDYPRHELRAPWYSGMAQGMILSLFVRMHRITGEADYLAWAKAIFASFWRSGPDDRPWVSRVSARRYLWIEEYPVNAHPDRVLNGFMFAIYGLYEYWKLTGSSGGRRILEGALTTLKAHVMLYRVPGDTSYYCLYHRTNTAENYHSLHISQLDQIAAMSGDAYFASVAELFRRDHAPIWR